MSHPERSCIVIVDEGSDLLASAVDGEVRRRGFVTVTTRAGQLSLLSLQMDRDTASVDDMSIGAVFFRAGPGARFSEGFQDADAAFCSNETRSAWLSVLTTESVVAINRPDPELWFAPSEWPVWRRRVGAAGLALSDLGVGTDDSDEPLHWLPWGGGVAAAPGIESRRAFAAALVRAGELRRSLWCCGRVIHGDGTAEVRDIGHVMESYGASLAGIVTDQHGRFVYGTGHPSVEGGQGVAAAALIAGALCDDMRRR